MLSLQESFPKKITKKTFECQKKGKNLVQYTQKNGKEKRIFDWQNIVLLNTTQAASVMSQDPNTKLSLFQQRK